MQVTYLIISFFLFHNTEFILHCFMLTKDIHNTTVRQGTENKIWLLVISIYRVTHMQCCETSMTLCRLSAFFVYTSDKYMFVYHANLALSSFFFLLPLPKQVHWFIVYCGFVYVITNTCCKTVAWQLLKPWKHDCMNKKLLLLVCGVISEKATNRKMLKVISRSCSWGT